MLRFLKTFLKNHNDVVFIFCEIDRFQIIRRQTHCLLDIIQLNSRHSQFSGTNDFGISRLASCVCLCIPNLLLKTLQSGTLHPIQWIKRIKNIFNRFFYPLMNCLCHRLLYVIGVLFSIVVYFYSWDLLKISLSNCKRIKEIYVHVQCKWQFMWLVSIWVYWNAIFTCTLPPGRL